MKLISYAFVFLFLIGCVSIMARNPNSGEKVVFTSNINKAKEILFFGNPSTSAAVREFVVTLDKINASLPNEDKVKTRILLELTTDFDTGKVPSPSEVMKSLNLSDLSFTYKAADLPQSPKHFISYISPEAKLASSLWLQDFGEFYFSADKPTFLDLDYSNLDETSEFHRYVTSPKGLNGQIDTNFRMKRDDQTMDTTLEGGDIEVLPNGVVLIGNLLHPGLQSYLKDNLKQKVLAVPADFVATGHVDEVFSIIPAPKDKTNGCGYALSYIDPLYGLRLALDKELKHTQPSTRADLIKAISYFTDGNGEKLIHRDQFQTIPKQFKKAKHLSIVEEPWGTVPNSAQWYVHRVLTIHEDVQRGIAQIKESLKGSCDDLKTVGLPVLLTDFGAGESTFSDMPITDGMSQQQMSDVYKKAPVYLFLSPINMLVVNQHLMMPVLAQMSDGLWEEDFTTSFQNPYRSVIKARLMALGIAESELHFINANAFVANGGSLHCGTATYRDKIKTVY